MRKTAEIWVAPSAEHRWLLAHAQWLVAPADGNGNGLSRLLRFMMVSPMTQLTFVSFDMQCFLYQVFHLTWVARLGHFFGMTAEIFFLLAAGAGIPIGASLHAGHLFAAVLAVWHVGVALSVGLRAWAVVAAGLLAVMLFGAEAISPLLAEWTQAPGWRGVLANPWSLTVLSALGVALSHAPEPQLPPRAVSGGRWRPLIDYVLGRGESIGAGRKMARALRIALYVPLGWLNELWAGLRLMPYGWLMLMFRFGYRPALWAELQAREARALATGNPAIDFIGVGGGTMLRSDGAGQYAPQSGTTSQDPIA